MRGTPAPVTARHGALTVIVGSTVGNAIAYGSAFTTGGAPGWAPWLLAVCTVLLLAALILLGTQRRGITPRAVLVPVALVTVILLAGFAAALNMGPVAADAPLHLGLPLGAAIVVYGIGLLPMLILPVAYALTFSASTLSAEDLARVRGMAAEREA